MIAGGIVPKINRVLEMSAGDEQVPGGRHGRSRPSGTPGDQGKVPAPAPSTCVTSWNIPPPSSMRMAHCSGRRSCRNRVGHRVVVTALDAMVPVRFREGRRPPVKSPTSSNRPGRRSQDEVAHGVVAHHDVRIAVVVVVGAVISIPVPACAATPDSTLTSVDVPSRLFRKSVSAPAVAVGPTSAGIAVHHAVSVEGEVDVVGDVRSRSPSPSISRKRVPAPTLSPFPPRQPG